MNLPSTNHSLLGQHPQDNFAIAEEEDKEQEANEMSAEKLKETEDDQEWTTYVSMGIKVQMPI